MNGEPIKGIDPSVLNEGIDPKSWNNHGSVIKSKEQWYVFYHASSNNSLYSRRERVERLTVDEDNGVITEAKISSKGFVEYMEAQDLTQPASAYRFTYGAYVTENKDGTHPLVNIYNDSGAVFDGVHFSEGKYKFSVNYTAFYSSILKLYIDEKLSAKIRLETINDTASTVFTVNENTSSVYMKICGCGGKKLCNVIDFKFERL